MTGRERLTQVKKLKSVEALADHLASLSITLPLSEPQATGALASTTSIVDGSVGELAIPNRFAVLPMEGWDGDAVGSPTELVERRWDRFASSGAGLVWAEATAVVPEGRANPHQLVLNEATVAGFAALRARMHPDQVVGLQLTHSGRYARPDADGPAPRIAYRHPVLDQRVGADDSHLLTDDELDQLVEIFVDRAGLAAEAGFDFVDVKACHGYLGHELLSAHDRPGRFGGDFAGRTRFFRAVVEGIRDAVPNLAVALRLSIFDFAPFSADADAGGVGVVDPASAGALYRFAFGGDGTGAGIDLTETDQLLDLSAQLGIGLISTTAGSPYYCPHVQRPAYFPPSDGYLPPDDPLVDVTRQIDATAELARRHPAMTIVGSGYSYLQQWLPAVGQAVIETDGATMVGLGRMALSYPNLPDEVLAGRPLENRLICRTFSDCTTAPRAGLVSGCFPLDPFYKDHEHRVELTRVKREIKGGQAPAH